MLPINYESWHHMPDSNKNQALANIKERFALEVSDDYIKKALGKRWRDNKSTLKKQYFKKDISLEEKLRNVPPGMLRYQWEDAVRFWNSKKGEDRERVGTSNRQKQNSRIAEVENCSTTSTPPIPQQVPVVPQVIDPIRLSKPHVDKIRKHEAEEFRATVDDDVERAEF
ncbi:uncharacterized protein LOC128282103 [Gossypium arboreum]|uniref:uncharacterized protein LOC128282103 n=1 Tax=Gossypium arboreum TaxID=29729 RepID=UPI0022F1890A|nr:uncharacterized protein LOC128282103 [Gossypium arboreum]